MTTATEMVPVAELEALLHAYMAKFYVGKEICESKYAVYYAWIERAKAARRDTLKVFADDLAALRKCTQST